MTHKSFDGRYMGIFLSKREYAQEVERSGFVGDGALGLFGFITHSDGTHSIVGHFPYRYPKGEYVPSLTQLPVYCNAEEKPLGPEAWYWDGDFEKPTLDPSLNSEDGEGRGWHGNLREGRWEGI